MLVTVPLGVLKSGRIAFEPPLPQYKQVAIQKVPMGCVNKFLLIWDSCFWDKEQYICYTAEQKDKFNYFINIKYGLPQVNALMTFAYADYSRETEFMSDPEIVEEIMKHLRDMYGDSIPYPKNM